MLPARSLCKPAALVAALAATATLAACGGGDQKAAAQAPAAAQPTLTVTAVAASTQLLPRTIQAPGTVAAWQDVPVAAESGGLTAVQVLADEGSYVRRGQVLVRMNDALIRAGIRQAEAQLASARASQAQANADYQRSIALQRQGYLSQASLDQRLAAQRTAAANVAAAQAGLSEANTRLGQTVVRAPVSGLITGRTVVLGQIVQPGQELFRLVRDGAMELNAQVPETEIGALRAGLPVQVALADVGEMTGVIRVVTPQVDPQSRLGIARVRLPARAGIRPGAFGTANIAVTAAPTVVVPQGSVVYRDGASGVFVLDRGNRARFRRVTTGERLGEQVSVVAGVNPGERVVVDGAGFLAEGDLVTVAAPRAPAARPAAPTQGAAS